MSSPARIMQTRWAVSLTIFFFRINQKPTSNTAAQVPFNAACSAGTERGVRVATGVGRRRLDHADDHDGND